MIITVDLNKLLKAGINLDEFTWLYLKHSGDEEGAQLWYDQFAEKIDYPGMLVVDEFCNREGWPTTKFVNAFFDSPDSMFLEFKSAFPETLPSGRRTHVNPTYCKNKYKKLVGSNQAIHDLLMKCLSLEISERKKKRSLDFMNNMDKWLEKENWKVYEEDAKKLGSISGLSSTGSSPKSPDALNPNLAI